MRLSSGLDQLDYNGKPKHQYVSLCFPKNLIQLESIGNPAGIGQGTGFGLRERDRDGIELGHRVRRDHVLRDRDETETRLD